MPIPSVFLSHTCDIVSNINGVVQRLDLTNIVGTYLVGETVTGLVSTKTAKVHTVGATYLLLTTLTGDFTSGETITGAGGATGKASGTNYDATDSFGVPITAPTTQSSVACVFFGAGGTLKLGPSGEVAVEKPTVIFSSGISVYEGDQITGTSEGFTTTYTAQNVEYVYLFTEVYMKVVTLEAVN